jgi:hypothetical protein
MPNTSCMIYMIPSANFHNPNSFNSFCTLSIAAEELAAKEERAAVAEVSVEVEAVAEVISPIASRRSHPAQFGETFDGPPSLERSGSEHREGAVTSPLPEERGLGRKWNSLWKGRRRDSKNFDRLYKSRKEHSCNPEAVLTQSPHSSDASRYESIGR